MGKPDRQKQRHRLAHLVTELDLDLQQLCAQPPYRRWLLHVARMAGIFSPTAGASENLQFREGRRSLGLDILREASRGLPRGTFEQMLALVLASEAKPQEDQDAQDSTLNDRE